MPKWTNQEISKIPKINILSFNLLKSMKIAITGSNWFVGSHLVQYFSANHDIIAFQRQKNKLQRNIIYKKWDITEAYYWEFDCDVFIHAAADTGYEKPMDQMLIQNVISLANVLDVVHRSNCKHLIYISTSSVYQWIYGHIDEQVSIDQKNLINSYSFTKFQAEKYLQQYLHKNIRLTILRPRAIYGEWDRVLIPNILRYQIFWRLVLLWNWENITSLTDIKYLIHAIDTIIHKQTSSFEIFNIADREAKKMWDIYTELAVKHDLRGIIKVPLSFLRPFFFMNPNKISYLLDTFWNDKVLNVEKLSRLC